MKGVKDAVRACSAAGPRRCGRPMVPFDSLRAIGVMLQNLTATPQAVNDIRRADGH